MWAEALTETFDFKVDHKISESQPYTDGDVTFTFTKGTKTTLAFNQNDPSLRLYYGATMTISVPEGGEISSIALTSSSPVLYIFTRDFISIIDLLHKDLHFRINN